MYENLLNKSIKRIFFSILFIMGNLYFIFYYSKQHNWFLFNFGVLNLGVTFFTLYCIKNKRFFALNDKS